MKLCLQYDKTEVPKERERLHSCHCGSATSLLFTVNACWAFPQASSAAEACWSSQQFESSQKEQTAAIGGRGDLMEGIVWPSSCGSSELLTLLINENCPGEEKQFEGRELVQRRGRTKAETDWEEKVWEGEVGRRTSMLEMFFLKIPRRPMIFSVLPFIAIRRKW